MPGGNDQVFDARHRSEIGQAVGRAGPQAGPAALDLGAGQARHELDGQPQQAVYYLELILQAFPNSRPAELAQIRKAQIQGGPVTAGD